MRSGGHTVQQALTAEAAAVVKQAMALARRRGHAQVTPLHVANIMLSAPTGLLRAACVQSHSHPLQCRALELCFNVALNRLPASTSSPILGPHPHHFPSISNALVAAFKRAQAHQRRGTLDSQQQPLLTVKIDLEQLIVSILDDPSVSRVMREAGFSSTQVKNKVEKAITPEISSSSQKDPSLSHTNSIKSKPNPAGAQPGADHHRTDPIRDEDIEYVMENLMSKRKRSFVVVGESVSTSEVVVRAVMEKMRNFKFINLSLPHFGHLNRVEIEQKIEELNRAVRNTSIGDQRVVLNLGDVKWAVEYRASMSEQGRDYYCPIEDMIMEIGKLVGGRNVGLMGIATFQTYMKCKSGHPSLETLWGLHPLTIPAGSLCFSLTTHNSEVESQSSFKKLETGGNCRSDSPTSSLPSWLQKCRDQNKEQDGSNHKDSAAQVKQLCKRWDIFSTSATKETESSERTPTLSSRSPSSSTSCFSLDQQYPELDRFWNFSSDEQKSSPNPNSASSNETVMEVDERVNKFKELSSGNLAILCSALERTVPLHSDVISEIAATILKCRSGTVPRKARDENGGDPKEETWLLFQGADHFKSKEKIGREIARVVFGSQEMFVPITVTSTSRSNRAESTDQDGPNKRLKEQDGSHMERLAEAVRCNPHRVFFVEDAEEADYASRIGFRRAMARGSIENGYREQVRLMDAVVIFSCERLRSRSGARSPSGKRNLDGEESGAVAPGFLDLNVSIHEDDEGVEDGTFGEVGLLESVDGSVVFKFREL